MQASGKSIQELAAEEDAEAEFDIAELFDDLGAAGMDDDDGPEARESGGEASGLVETPESTD